MLPSSLSSFVVNVASTGSPNNVPWKSIEFEKRFETEHPIVHYRRDTVAQDSSIFVDGSLSDPTIFMPKIGSVTALSLSIAYIHHSLTTAPGVCVHTCLDGNFFQLVCSWQKPISKRDTPIYQLSSFLTMFKRGGRGSNSC